MLDRVNWPHRQSLPLPLAWLDKNNMLPGSRYIKYIKIYIHLFVCMCVYICVSIQTCHNTQVEVRGKAIGAGSLPSCGSLGSGLIHFASSIGFLDDH